MPEPLTIDLPNGSTLKVSEFRSYIDFDIYSESRSLCASFSLSERDDMVALRDWLTAAIAELEGEKG